MCGVFSVGDKERGGIRKNKENSINVKEEKVVSHLDDSEKLFFFEYRQRLEIIFPPRFSSLLHLGMNK